MRHIAKTVSTATLDLGRFIVCLGMLVLIQLVGVAPASATGVYDLPPSPSPDTWVYDKADILSRLTETKVGEAFEKLAEQTGNEVRFITIHRLDYGETIDSFTQHLFQQWFPTPEAQANQALVVLDNVTNTVSIETGDKVKSLLTDETATSVAEETLLVPLRSGNKYNQAFSDASDRLLAILSGQPDPGPTIVVTTVQTEGTFATPNETKKSNATVWVIGLLVAATVIPMATYYLYQLLQS